MKLPKRYDFRSAEPRLRRFWQVSGIYNFEPASEKPVYSIDTPPATVSGHLHMGHIYSYSHADFVARFRRMNGCNVFYPMGFDDNGLPTERLVERLQGVTAAAMGRQAFIAACLALGEGLEQEYRALWEQLGLSVDFRYTYRTIDDRCRRISQYSFIELYHQGWAYRSQAPTIWCPTCHTAIAQAEIDDLTRESEFVTLPFDLDGDHILPIATTRPELLPACVAVFVHPDDERYQGLIGQALTVPLAGHTVPILADPAAEPKKGTGAVMCCTFGDATDVAWWRTHDLPLRSIIDANGRLTGAAGELAGLTVAEARRQTIARVQQEGLLLDQQQVEQTIRVHERCDTPVEYLVTPQWYIRILDAKEQLLAAGEQIQWHPPHTQVQYRNWVENLGWDWGISRQRAFGVPIPVWYCNGCGEVLPADKAQLPVDPATEAPPGPCPCGDTSFTPETDVLDTWATSSLTPLIVSGWTGDAIQQERLFPMSLRPQAHEIIRTWAFYTIVKSLYHTGALPWENILISGWGLAPKGTGKISKSRGGGPIAPVAAFDQYSVDAVRYWAASTSPGKDSIISQEKMNAGAKLVTKLWNVARFSERFLGNYRPPAVRPSLSPADGWILSSTQNLIRRVTDAFEKYDYALAKNETEIFFWTLLADNYIEMAKQRLYDANSDLHNGARYTLYHVLLTVLKLFAPILPYVTEEIYQGLLASGEEDGSIHRAAWPTLDEALRNEAAEQTGEALLAIAAAVRRYKSERQLSLGAELPHLHLATRDRQLAEHLHAASEDIASTTRALAIQISGHLEDGCVRLQVDGEVDVAVTPAAE